MKDTNRLTLTEVKESKSTGFHPVLYSTHFGLPLIASFYL